jgi:hypothetical protein
MGERTRDCCYGIVADSQEIEWWAVKDSNLRPSS